MLRKFKKLINILLRNERTGKEILLKSPLEMQKDIFIMALVRGYVKLRI